jgi:L-fuculose-phosphate aldolase
MMLNENQCRNDIVKVGKLLYDRKLMVSTDGNISVRLSDNEILITSSGFCKGFLTPELITKVDMEGNIISGLKPARDIRMHLAVYRTRKEARAVVHSHPPITTGFAITSTTFEKVTLPEVMFALGSVAVTEYAAPTTAEVPVVVEKKLRECPESQALILANHGALTIASDVMEAYYKMETLEMFLTATLVSKILGKENSLSDSQVREVKEIIKTSAKPVENTLVNTEEMKLVVSQVVDEVVRRLNK